MALFQAEHGQRVLFLTSLSIAERSADLLNCKVEHKGNPENSLPRNSLAFKAQSLSLTWLPWLSHLTTSSSLPSTLPAHPSVLPRGGAISYFPPLLLALGPPALQQEALVREADSGLFHRDCPMEWPTLWGAPPPPPLPQRP